MVANLNERKDAAGLPVVAHRESGVVIGGGALTIVEKRSRNGALCRGGRLNVQIAFNARSKRLKTTGSGLSHFRGCRMFNYSISIFTNSPIFQAFWRIDE